ncbi:MAG: hypothetical protein K8E24_012335, partial [Methanobacterium paludis]|nr:hypothetical protein [Methanobacterium paludis]
EDEKESFIFKEADEERKFKVNYCEAISIVKNIENGKLDSMWEIHSMELELNVDTNNEFEISEKFIKNDNDKWIIPSAEEKIEDHRLVKIKGKIKNLSGNYKIKIEDVGKYGINKSTYEADGYMIINETFDIIDTLEKSDGNNSNIEKWEKISEINGEEMSYKSDISDST